MKKTWYGTIAEYLPEHNLVSERTVIGFDDYVEAEKWINEIDASAYVWSDNCTELDNPLFASIYNEAYYKEYEKIID